MHLKAFRTLLIAFALSSTLTLTTGVQIIAQDASPPSTQALTPVPSANATPVGATPATATASAAPAPIAYDTQPLPADPAAALLMASKANGLGGEGLKPWYLKAHYQTYDAKGATAAQGVIEVWWAAQNHSRVSYTSAAFTGSFYRSSDGDFRVGSTSRVPYAESLIWREIMHPVQLSREPATPKFRKTKLSNIDMTCLDLPFTAAPMDAYCLGAQKLELRTFEQRGYAAVFNKIMSFQHRFVSSEISVRDGAQQVLTISVDDLRGLRESDLPALSVPDGAIKTIPIIDASEADPKSSAKGGVSGGTIVFKGKPSYPAEAKQRRAQGTVRIWALIGRDGLVHDPVVVRDPDAALSGAALKTVSQRYSPYLLDGVPVDVETSILVTFTLGG